MDLAVLIVGGYLALSVAAAFTVAAYIRGNRDGVDAEPAPIHFKRSDRAARFR